MDCRPLTNFKDLRKRVRWRKSQSSCAKPNLARAVPLQGTAGSSRALGAHRNDKILGMRKLRLQQQMSRTACAKSSIGVWRAFPKSKAGWHSERVEGPVRNPLFVCDHEPMPLQRTAGSSRASGAHRNDKILKYGPVRSQRRMPRSRLCKSLSWTENSWRRQLVKRDVIPNRAESPVRNLLLLYPRAKDSARPFGGDLPPTLTFPVWVGHSCPTLLALILLLTLIGKGTASAVPLKAPPNQPGFSRCGRAAGENGASPVCPHIPVLVSFGVRSEPRLFALCHAANVVDHLVQLPSE